MQTLYAMNPEEDDGKKKFETIEKSITFQNISFSYPSTDREVLSCIDLEIEK